MLMAKEMYPEFDVEDFINLPNYRIYLKLMIDGKPSRAFSAITDITCVKLPLLWKVKIIFSNLLKVEMRDLTSSARKDAI